MDSQTIAAFARVETPAHPALRADPSPQAAIGFTHRKVPPPLFELATSVGIPPTSDFKKRQQQNLQIKQQVPVVDVPEITIHPRFHLLYSDDLSPTAIHLGPPRDS